MGIFDKKESEKESGVNKGMSGNVNGVWAGDSMNGTIRESDFSGFDAYAWHLYETYWKMQALQTVSFERIDRDYYKAELSNGGVIFFNSARNECRTLSKEDTTFPTEESWLREFRIRLNHAMETRGINQYDLAELTGYSQSSISYYCSGRRCPSTYALMKIVRCLKCPIEFLTKFP